MFKTLVPVQLDLVRQSFNANFVSVSINNAPVKNSVIDVKTGCLCATCGTVRFRNDQIVRNIGYGDYQLENVVILRSVYFPEHQRLRAGYGTDDYLISTLDLGKFNAKAKIRIFVGYALAKKAFRIYNRRTRIISETIHVTFNELTTMAFEQFSSGPELHVMTSATPSTGLVSNLVSQQPCIPQNKDDWDRLFQPMFDEYFNPPIIVVSSVQETVAPRAKVLADSPVSISISQDAPSTSIPSSQAKEHSLIIS
uniref:Integrase, catalytic region, zinc finger, CCHC-type, peptidase aspartic, catalytic n=1 Tax=Tanacetum cinerariifolium TaxID=118510 RepID=A0A699JUL8_TANCI|nr:integrase, catalytic region, zinc finger, CCHC-type, peptidase aspartic, catalytic [Tanacetum cinerariifolium]